MSRVSDVNAFSSSCRKRPEAIFCHAGLDRRTSTSNRPSGGPLPSPIILCLTDKPSIPRQVTWVAQIAGCYLNFIRCKGELAAEFVKVRFLAKVRLMILGQATIEALEAPNPSDARKREIKSPKKHETYPPC